MTKEEIENQIHDFALRINSMGFLDGYSKGLDDKKKEIEKAKREGYDDGVTDTIFNTDTYIQGLNDAWECARKIVLSSYDGGIPYKKFTEVFDNISSVSPYYIFENCSASEVIAKIKKYEEQHTDNEIKLWDEVIIKRSSLGFEGTKGIVINTNPSEFNGLIEVLINYATSHHYKPENLEKTGKSYPELANILEQLKGDNDQ